MEAMKGPTKVAVVKVRGNQTGNSYETVGNAAADSAAKAAAGYYVGINMVTMDEERLREGRAKAIREWAGAQADHEEEQDSWKKKGATFINKEVGPGETVGIWVGPQGDMLVTGEVMRWLVDKAHGPAHNGVNQMRK